MIRRLTTVDRIVRSAPGSDDTLNAELQSEGLGLRVVVNKIPPVFGDFFLESAV